MKFLNSEHKEIVAEIQKNHRLEKEFVFSKSKGNLKITDQANGKEFTFYREDKTEIGPSGQWLEVHTYYENSTRKHRIGNQERLLTKLSEWLTSR